ncbi:MAG: 50S ribosomal protein L35 [Myxococcota bacterium]
MTKMKTKRGAAKRFSITGTGKLKHAAKGRRHCLGNKSRKRKRSLKKARFLAKDSASLIYRAIPYQRTT